MNLQDPVRLSQESLFGFLTSTRLPLVSSLSQVMRWGALGFAAWCALLVLLNACFVDDCFWSAQAWFGGVLPSLVGAPLFFLAWRQQQAKQFEWSARLLLLGVILFSILANWPRGAFSLAWYLQPLFALLAAVSLGVVPGLLLALVSVFGVLAVAYGEAALPARVATREIWVHATSLAALTIASALAGAIVNRLFFMTLMTAEAQRRKNSESSRALRNREKLLRHALRIETVGDLAGMVCHQLRNAFQVLLGHVTLAETGDDKERQQRLAMIEQVLADARPLLDELMRLAHPDDGDIERVNVARLLHEFHEQAARVLPSSITLSLEVAGDLPRVLLNGSGLSHALWNLVINARHAIKGDGTIQLRAGADHAQVWIEVADTGCGMPQEVRERIFDPYFTTKPKGQGTGLGLTAVARFVRSSNGLVQVDSTVGRGTTFRLRFPAVAGDPARQEDAAPEARTA